MRVLIRNYLDKVDPWARVWGIVLVVNEGGKTHSVCGWHHFRCRALDCVRVGEAG